MRATITAACILMFFVAVLLALYQIGAGAGVFKGGYAMMASYYMSTYSPDRPLSFILADKDERSEMGAALVVQDARSMRFFRTKVGDDLIQEYTTGVWIVRGVSQRDLFLYLRSMEIGIVATGVVIIASIVLPIYLEGRRI